MRVDKTVQAHFIRLEMNMVGWGWWGVGGWGGIGQIKAGIDNKVCLEIVGEHRHVQWKAIRQDSLPCSIKINIVFKINIKTAFFTNQVKRGNAVKLTAFASIGTFATIVIISCPTTVVPSAKSADSA